ncbi:pyridoxine 4-dehydrogenase PWA37_000829 [Arxiozyma heterogenica]|uniref:NADP-dependent oxidoreductase domain-containing protein n=1 Tax=Arxiozyma heterogenica TaxID=278026 RepID=A0AAN7W5T5_9SACH|nr:hypothetical protein RI543_000640 [Kazachstania heterogenica]
MSRTSDIVNDLRQIQTGYGLMSLTWRPEPIPKDIAFVSMKRVIDIALERNTKAFFNVGEFYGLDKINLILVKEFFEKYPNLRQHVIISCKGGVDDKTLSPKGKYASVIESIETSLKYIGGYIDIFEVARLDTSILKEGEVYPYESFKALADKIEEGRIGAISLSEVNELQIRSIHNDWKKYLACVEVELSLFSTNILYDGVAKACSDLGLVIICYSPLGRGLLTGHITPSSTFKPGDFRAVLKRFQTDSLIKNQVCIDFLNNIVKERPEDQKCSLVQLALGWVKYWNSREEFKGAKFIPIPSGSTVDKVNENFNEEKGKITEKEFEKINEFLKTFQVAGDRYEMAIN